MLAQLYILLIPHMGREPYRESERMHAIIAWEQSHTPETKAAMDTEDKLLSRHIRLRAALYLGGFLLVNGVLFYAFWNYEARKATA
jgi:hypothetical protein